MAASLAGVAIFAFTGSPSAPGDAGPATGGMRPVAGQPTSGRPVSPVVPTCQVHGPHFAVQGADAMLSPGGDRLAGAALLRRGLGLAEGLGAEPLLEELDALARRARVSTRQATASASQPPAARLAR